MVKHSRATPLSMVKVRLTEHARGVRRGPRVLVTWLGRCLAVLLIPLFLIAAVGSLIGDGGYLGYLATRGTVFDAWGVMSIISALLSATAVAGTGYALLRRRLSLALGFAFLAAPAPFVIAASQCDTAASCSVMGWAALPASAFTWEVRLRPVTDPNEARAIASAALWKAGASGSPFRAKRFADHWIVSVVDRDGWPAPRAVRIDTRTAKTSLVACPADKVQCGMERPIVSDGRRVFRNDRLGLAAIFPASRPVCTSRGDDDEPRGFYSMVREPDRPCEVFDDSRQMGVEVAQYRLNGCAVAQAPSVPWRPLSPATAKLFRNPAHTLAGQPAVACELHQHGQIQISLYAPAVSRSNPGPSAGALYDAYIVTTPAHLAEDVRSFEVFLEGVRIGSPAGARID